MAGYPPSGYGYPPPPPYGAAPYGAPPNPYPTPYGAPAAPYPGEKPGKADKLQQPGAYGVPPVAAPYGAPYGAPVAGDKPWKAEKLQQHAGSGYGTSPFAALLPSVFPPGTDPTVVGCFQMADQDGSGFIDDKELQRALSAYNQSFSLRTVHLLMYLFTNSNLRKIGPKEFSSLFYSLQSWRAIFERFDRDRSGKIDSVELREALLSMGYSVSPLVLELLVSKYDKSGGKNRAIEYDHFIECCLTVKGLTEKFKEKDIAFSGSAMFTYEAFMVTVLPFLIA